MWWFLGDAAGTLPRSKVGSQVSPQDASDTSVVGAPPPVWSLLSDTPMCHALSVHDQEASALGWGACLSRLSFPLNAFLLYPHDKLLVFKAHLRVSFLFSRLSLGEFSVFLQCSWRNTSFEAFVEGLHFCVGAGLFFCLSLDGQRALWE